MRNCADAILLLFTYLTMPSVCAVSGYKLANFEGASYEIKFAVVVAVARECARVAERPARV